MTRPLTQISVIQDLLKAHQHIPKRTSGQNFLVCESPITKTVEEITQGSPTVTELGAGIGTLTQALLAANVRVRAIERDPILASILQNELASQDNLDLVLGDIRDTEWSWRKKPYQLVGNIPYNLSGFILRRLTETPNPPEQAIFMVQQEVGQRLTATPPDMSLLSVVVQLWGSARRLQRVSARCFWPQPKVDSELIAIKSHALYSRAEQINIVNLAKPIFQSKRKQIAGTLSRKFNLSRDQVRKLLNIAGIRPTQRPQELSLYLWHKLVQVLATARN